LVGIIFYTEAFLSLKFSETISSINITWYEASLKSSDIMLYFFCFSLFYGAIVPLLLLVVNSYLESTNLSFAKLKSNEIRLSAMKEDAIIEGNSALYSNYQNILYKIEENERIRKLALSVIILFCIIFVSYFHSGSDEGLLNVFWAKVAGDGLLSIVIRIILTFTSFWVLVLIFDNLNEHDYIEKINRYDSRLEGHWLNEISCGLLEKNEIIECLTDILSSYQKNFDTPSFELKYDFKNYSHKFCKTHGLIKVTNGEIELTSKGNFFSKYIPIKKSW
jgi:hypothetical protein